MAPHVPDPEDEPTGLAGGPGPAPPGLDDGTLAGAPRASPPEPDPAAREAGPSEASHRFETESDRQGEESGDSTKPPASSR